jgi:predicted nuclease with TOPRIM domain
MTKQKLGEENEELREQIEDLQSELDNLNDAYTDIEYENAQLQNELNNQPSDRINDIEDFKFRLRNDNLMSPELEQFIDNYLKWHNK